MIANAIRKKYLQELDQLAKHEKLVLNTQTEMFLGLKDCEDKEDRIRKFDSFRLYVNYLILIIGKTQNLAEKQKEDLTPDEKAELSGLQSELENREADIKVILELLKKVNNNIEFYEYLKKVCGIGDYNNNPDGKITIDLLNKLKSLNIHILADIEKDKLRNEQIDIRDNLVLAGIDQRVYGEIKDYDYTNNDNLGKLETTLKKITPGGTKEKSAATQSTPARQTKKEKLLKQIEDLIGYNKILFKAESDISQIDQNSLNVLALDAVKNGLTRLKDESLLECQKDKKEKLLKEVQNLEDTVLKSKRNTEIDSVLKNAEAAIEETMKLGDRAGNDAKQKILNNWKQTVENDVKDEDCTPEQKERKYNILANIDKNINVLKFEDEFDSLIEGAQEGIKKIVLPSNETSNDEKQNSLLGIEKDLEEKLKCKDLTKEQQEEKDAVRKIINDLVARLKAQAEINEILQTASQKVSQIVSPDNQDTSDKKQNDLTDVKKTVEKINDKDCTPIQADKKNELLKGIDRNIQQLQHQAEVDSILKKAEENLNKIMSNSEIGSEEKLIQLTTLQADFEKQLTGKVLTDLQTQKKTSLVENINNNVEKLKSEVEIDAILAGAATEINNIISPTNTASNMNKQNALTQKVTEIENELAGKVLTNKQTQKKDSLIVCITENLAKLKNEAEIDSILEIATNNISEIMSDSNSENFQKYFHLEEIKKIIEEKIKERTFTSQQITKKTEILNSIDKNQKQLQYEKIRNRVLKSWMVKTVEEKIRDLAIKKVISEIRHMLSKVDKDNIKGINLKTKEIHLTSDNCTEVNAAPLDKENKLFQVDIVSEGNVYFFKYNKEDPNKPSLKPMKAKEGEQIQRIQVKNKMGSKEFSEQEKDIKSKANSWNNIMGKLSSAPTQPIQQSPSAQIHK